MKQISTTTKKRREKASFSERHSPIHGREYPGRNSRQDQARTVPGAISFTHSYPERKRKFLISRERHYFTCGERQQTRNHITHTSTSQDERKEKRARHHSIHREELSPQRRIQTRGKPQDNHLYNICKTTYRQREESRLFSHTNGSPYRALIREIRVPHKRGYSSQERAQI